MVFSEEETADAEVEVRAEDTQGRARRTRGVERGTTSGAAARAGIRRPSWGRRSTVLSECSIDNEKKRAGCELRKRASSRVRGKTCTPRSEGRVEPAARTGRRARSIIARIIGAP